MNKKDKQEVKAALKEHKLDRKEKLAAANLEKTRVLSLIKVQMLDAKRDAKDIVAIGKLKAAENQEKFKRLNAKINSEIKVQQDDIKVLKVKGSDQMIISGESIKLEKKRLKTSKVEFQSSIVSQKKDLKMKMVKAMHDLKLEELSNIEKNKESKKNLENKLSETRSKIADAKTEQRHDQLQQKLKLAESKNELRNLKNTKRSDEKKRRLEENIKLKAQKEQLRLENELAKQKHKKIISELKNDAIGVLKEEAKHINETKSSKKKKEKEIQDKINDEILATQQAEHDELAKLKSVVIKEESSKEFISELESGDLEQYKPKQSLVSITKGMLVESFGKKGERRYAIAQQHAVESDVVKYVKQDVTFDKINEFRKIIKNEKPISLSSLFRYVDVSLCLDLSAEMIKKRQVHLVTGLLMLKPIEFADGFLVPSRMGKTTIVEFRETILSDESLLAFENEKLHIELNKIATAKLNSGTNIRLAKGLLIMKEDGLTRVLFDTNFVKA